MHEISDIFVNYLITKTLNTVTQVADRAYAHDINGWY